jgi:hypothetical protein
MVLRRIINLGHATLDLYESWRDDDIDSRDRFVIAHAAELLALLAMPRQGAAADAARQRGEVAAQLDRLLSENPG